LANAMPIPSGVFFIQDEYSFGRAPNLTADIAWLHPKVEVDWTNVPVITRTEPVKRTWKCVYCGREFTGNKPSRCHSPEASSCGGSEFKLT